VVVDAFACRGGGELDLEWSDNDDHKLTASAGNKLPRKLSIE
jgi:hypothetical protein